MEQKALNKELGSPHSIKKLKQNDSKEWEKVYTLCKDTLEMLIKVHKFKIHLDSKDDILSNVFEKILKKIRTIESDEIFLDPDTNNAVQPQKRFESWLKRIIKYTIIDSYNKLNFVNQKETPSLDPIESNNFNLTKNAPQLYFHYFETLTISEENKDKKAKELEHLCIDSIFQLKNDPVDSYLYREIKRIFHHILNEEKNSIKKIAFLLKECFGHKIKEVAKVLKIQEYTATNYIYRFSKEIKEKLQIKGIEFSKQE